MNCERLKRFRQEAYQLLGQAKDATFELMDAVLLTRSVYSFAELSLSPVFRRRWSSLYEAVEDCRPRRNKLMKLYIKQISPKKRLILAGDHTRKESLGEGSLKAPTFKRGSSRSSDEGSPLPNGSSLPWSRVEAVTLKDRTFEHGTSTVKGKPVTLGHGYSTLAWIPEEQGSWALPLRHERITSHETPMTLSGFSVEASMSSSSHSTN